MKTSRLLFVPTAALTVSMAVAQPPSSPRPAQAQAPVQPKPAQAVAKPAAAAPAPAPEDIADDPWEERKIRAREDVEYLEALHRAKQTECREVELRTRHAVTFKSDIDRQRQKGYTSAFVTNQSDMSVAAAQSELELRRAELKDVEIRLARARRRLRAIERSPSAIEAEASQSQADDRLRELELKYERLRRELEATRRVLDHRTRPGRSPGEP